MTSLHVTAAAVIHAPPRVVYAIVADYRDGHARILPRAFDRLQVTEGGTGAGTRIQYRAKLLGVSQTVRMTVAEPEPGRVLTETDEARGTVTTFTFEPVPRRSTRVTIATRVPRRRGPAGWIEAKLLDGFLRRAFEEELSLLTEVARERYAPTLVERAERGARRFGGLDAALREPEGVVRVHDGRRKRTTLPPEIATLVGLESLVLDGAGLEELPDELWTLERLRFLGLYHNGLRRLPSGIARLHRLEKLVLGVNPLAALPPEVGELSRLRHLNLANLRELDWAAAWPTVCRLRSLERLSVYQSPVGALPAEVGGLGSLRVLRAFACGLAEVPAEIETLTSLEELDLRANRLSTLPFDVARLPRLRVLDVSYNRLSWHARDRLRYGADRHPSLRRVVGLEDWEQEA